MSLKVDAMPNPRTPLLLAFGLAAAGAALCGCGKAEDASGYTGSAPVANEVKTPPPPVPAWAAPYMGRDVKTVSQFQTTCGGSVDTIAKRFTGAHPAMTVEGWGWDEKGAKPLAKVLLTNAVGNVIGAAVVGNLRPDVPKAMPEVKTQAVGWKGVVLGNPDTIKAWGLTDKGALCQIGAIDT